MSCEELRAQLEAAGCIKRVKPGDKPWTLKSGKTSDIYIDLRGVGAFPRLIRTICQRLAQLLPTKCDYVAGLPLGGVPLATLVSQESAVPLMLIRKAPKEHGTGRVVEADISKPTDVVLIDDVLTEGTTVRETVHRIQQQGVPLNVVAVVCIVNRHETPTSVVPGTEIPLRSLLTLQDLVAARAPYPFETRASMAHHPQAQRLFARMSARKTNLCWSADITDPRKLLDVFAQVAPFIAVIKLHFDTIDTDDIRSFVRQLDTTAKQHGGVMVMADRKFADIGATVERQLACHPARDVMELCTVHTMTGPAPLRALSAQKRVGSVVIAQMSHSGSLIDPKSLSAIAVECWDAIAGVVCQSRAECDMGDGVVYMTPGVHLTQSSDGADQRYRDCHTAIAVQKNDMVIVGRGINSAADPAVAAEEYRKQAWAALMTKLDL